MSSHTATTELTFLGKLVLEGEIVCQTGLHIGAGKGSLEIGGSDNPVVKDAAGRPYIPGSSLRGKIRSLLEQFSGVAVPSEMVYISRRKGQEVRIHQSDKPDDDIPALEQMSVGRSNIDAPGGYRLAVKRIGGVERAAAVEYLGQKALNIGRHMPDHEYCGIQVL